MNRAEKNWNTELLAYFQSKLSARERASMLTLDEYVILSFEQNKSSRRFYTTAVQKRRYAKFISPHLGSKKLDEIKIGDIKLWFGYLTENVNSHKYAKDIKSILSTILNDAMEDEYIDKNVVFNTRFPSNVNFSNINSVEIDPFNLNEVNTLIDNAIGQFKNIVTFQFFTATRPGEMIALQWEDVNFESKTIYIRRTRQGVVNPETGIKELGSTKTGTNRKIDMLPIVEKALRLQYMETGLKGGFVFLTQHNKPYMDYDCLRKRQWKDLLKRCHIHYRNFYQTRHTFASIFLSEGEDLAWISKVMLGHSSIQTTLKHYAKFIKQKDVQRGTFLNDERTNSVQYENTSTQSS